MLRHSVNDRLSAHSLHLDGAVMLTDQQYAPDMIETSGQCKPGSGEFTEIEGERYYVIRGVDHLPPFLVSLVSSDDHWLFASSSGGLTAGRTSPESALFPYVTVDKVHECAPHTGGKTLLRVNTGAGWAGWEPLNREHDFRYRTSRHLYKNILGNKLCFEEFNDDLQLVFRCSWQSSARFGIIRRCELLNLADHEVEVELLDGLQNLLPAGTPPVAQANSSNLVDAYKWSELDVGTGLAYFTLYAGISDRAEPCESLRATTVFCLGLEPRAVLLSTRQLADFKRGRNINGEICKRGVRGAYMVHDNIELAAGQSRHWQFAADVEQSQAGVVSLRKQLKNPEVLAGKIKADIERGSDKLARIMASADGFQVTAEEHVGAHHYANTLFNTLRGGIFYDQSRVPTADFVSTLKWFNRDRYRRHASGLEKQPDVLEYSCLQELIARQGDAQLERLGLEYLPVTFGRRHGDPSRPWNHFAIHIRNEDGSPRLSYQGNWRDIFQNWEALAFSFPDFAEGMIAKFVNASTVDGYNPYRIAKKGIDWEVEDPDDPWSYIGYWGDHQVIYLLKLLELSRQFHPDRLDRLLQRRIFCYANVPYRIKPFEELLENPKSTIVYDADLARRIEQRVTSIGADGKLILDAEGQVYLVNLLEKLLVPLLAKLGNLVIEGGIWLNTQRPEWNDANNALVGNGLSVVTLNYMRRYVHFLKNLLSNRSEKVSLSLEVSRWLEETATVLADIRCDLESSAVSDEQRWRFLVELGKASSQYRQAVYTRGTFAGTTETALALIHRMLDNALVVIDHSIRQNRRDDGLYHAYNLLKSGPGRVEVDSLYPMLEGQVAVLSSGIVEPAEAVSILEALFGSAIYRPDQHSFMLYPDRDLPGFLEKNRIGANRVKAIPLLAEMLAKGDASVVLRDADDHLRFNADIRNASDLVSRIEALATTYGDLVERSREALLALYEQTFNHRAFTGRSGTMFGFEGLGCIYWHMVSKLLLAVAENFFSAQEQGADREICQRLGNIYYRIREGLCFNKTPLEYGAFPTDPYSHTPSHDGAQQPGMTGQVKEELLARFMELGIRVNDGAAHFNPALLRPCEFTSVPKAFRYLDVNNDWRTLEIPPAGLAFTWCQTPVVMRLDDNAARSLVIRWNDGTQLKLESLQLPPEASAELFARSGKIRQLELILHTEQLFTA